jgi:hypothetical protein
MINADAITNLGRSSPDLVQLQTNMVCCRSLSPWRRSQPWAVTVPAAAAAGFRVLYRSISLQLYSCISLRLYSSISLQLYVLRLSTTVALPTPMGVVGKFSFLLTLCSERLPNFCGNLGPPSRWTRAYSSIPPLPVRGCEKGVILFTP